MGNPFCIVLIDEDRQVRTKMKAMLAQHAEWEIVDFSDSIAALAFIQRQRPDVIISDVNIPETNGYEFCRQIRSLYSLHELPIILLTPFNSLSQITQVYRSGANYYVAKGAPDHELLNRVERIVQYRSVHIGPTREEHYLAEHSTRAS